MGYNSNQSFNKWNEMLGGIYDKTQNYSKSAYEIHCHLTEVTGGFGKYLIKKRDYQEAKGFLASIFSWALALIRKVTDNQNITKVDKIIFTKFPGVCPYCLTAPCSCFPNKKNTGNYKKLKYIVNSYIQNNEGDFRVKDIQKMISGIYLKTWNRYSEIREQGMEIQFNDLKEIAHYNVVFLFSRLTEELAEIAEAIRFYHLYKSNFENEMADFFAWYFAIVSIFHNLYDNPERNIIDLERLLWDSFPGLCYFCNMPQCVCRPGPVRELLSRPSIDEYQNYDEETQTENNFKLIEHIERIQGMGEINRNIFPISTIKLVIVNYSKIKSNKEQYSKFLREVSSVLRKKIRYDKDKFYRTADDELLVFCTDTIKKEVEGVKERIEKLLDERNTHISYPLIKLKLVVATYPDISALISQINY